jgi:hypothetical protein
MDGLFTHRNEIEGKVGIGKVPDELHSTLDDISKEYVHKIPDKSSTTYHTYYHDLTGKLKENFDKIQYDKFWNNISDNNPKCVKQCVIEMNEIYYSNPKPNFEINPDHPIIRKLDGLRHSDADLAKQVGVQLLENAMVAAGLTEDPRAMLGRLNQLLEKLLPQN